MNSTGRLGVIVIFIVCAFCAVMQWMNGDAGDKGWIYYSAQRWLEGKHLYSELFSALPPLIFWLNALPAAFGKLFNISAATMLAGFGCAVAALSITVCCALMRRLATFDRRMRNEFTLLLVFIFCIWSHALYFADREHLFLMLVFPYLLRWMPSLAPLAFPLPLRLLVGAMAAVGFCIKPHCALVFITLQLVAMLQMRTLRILVSWENVIIYAGGLIYLVAVAFEAPDYYFIVLPMSLITYSATADAKAMVFYGSISLLLALVASADYRLRDQSPYRRDIWYFAGLCFGFLLYGLSNSGWGYTWNPLNEMILLTTAFIYWQHRFQAEQGQEERRHRFGMRACRLSFIFNTLAVLVLYGGALAMECDAACKIDRDMKALVEMVEQKQPSSFGSISVDFAHAATLAQATGVPLVTRFNHLWMLPKFFVSGDAFATQHAWIVDYITTAYAQDLNKHKPALVFVDDTNRFFSIIKDVDLIAYLSRNDDFRSAWSHYRFLMSLDYCKEDAPVRGDCKYDVYERTAP